MSQVPEVREVSEFLAILSLLTWAATLVTIVLVVAHRMRPGSAPSRLLDDIREVALRLAFVVALVATLGSLYLSEVAHFHPCPLCWYQRICLYPLSVVLSRAARSVATATCGPTRCSPALIGAAIATYHTQLQAFPKQAHVCNLGADSCLTRWVWEFGFVSIPFMSLAAFSFIITMLRSSGPLPPGELGANQVTCTSKRA